LLEGRFVGQPRNFHGHSQEKYAFSCKHHPNLGTVLTL
jgi:hypothetical protein